MIPKEIWIIYVKGEPKIGYHSSEKSAWDRILMDSWRTKEAAVKAGFEVIGYYMITTDNFAKEEEGK